MDQHGRTSPRRPDVSEKTLWACAILTGVAALIVGPLVGGTQRAVIVPLAIAVFITASALTARRRRLGAADPAA